MPRTCRGKVRITVDLIAKWPKSTVLSENHHVNRGLLSSFPAESSYHIESKVLRRSARAAQFGRSIAM